MTGTVFKYRQEALDLFLERFPGIELPEQERLRAVLCPEVVDGETAQTHTGEGPDALQLLMLRLYEAGFRDPASMASLCGVRQGMVEKALDLLAEEVTGDA